MSSWSVVVPSCRPDQLGVFLAAWLPLFKAHDVRVIVVCDARRNGDKAPPNDWIYTYHWDDITDWIPRGTDMIRSWGIYQAWLHGSDYTLSLDDDVTPISDRDIFAEYEAVFAAGAVCSPFLDVGAFTSSGLQMRGFPARDRTPATVAVQYGGWDGVLDLDAKTQLANPNLGPQSFLEGVFPVPRGSAVTTCAMNMAWRTEYAPIMWQLPMLSGRFNRFGDIWSGLFQKRVLDTLDDVMVVNGRAKVLHERLSDPVKNLERELPGLPLNEHLWGALDDEYQVGPLVDVYRHVTDIAAEFFYDSDPEYGQHFEECRDNWLALFV